MNVPITFDERVVKFDEMERLPEGGWRRKDLAPGAAWWLQHMGEPTNKISHLYFVCPCGCGDVLGIPVTQRLEGFSGCWKWDGNEGHPTLTPSVSRLVGCKWHGHLTKGIFDSV